MEHRISSLARVAGVIRVMKSPFNVRRSAEACSNRLQGPAARVCRRNSLLPTLVFLGVLAVVCSAVSPADDDVQQVFFHKTPQCSRVAPEISFSTDLPGNRTIQAAVLLTSPPASGCELAATISVAESHVHAELFPSTKGERSPPIR